MFVVFVLLSAVVHAQANDGIAKDHKVDVDPYRIIRNAARQYSGRQIFDFRKNGLRVDVRIVPSLNNDSSMDDDFPEFPTKDIGRCILDLSLVCAKKRLGRFLESIRDLNEIYLMGQQIKLVKTRINVRRSNNDGNATIERSVNDFFDTFALRITLPRWNGNREKNQIDVTFDETAVSEGRGKGGGGGKGGKGGKCKMMMMAGLMMLKMKLIGVATMKGMMMSGMSLMLSMVMLMQKYMKGGGGGGYHGGGGGGGGQYKEVVLLTKASGGGGGGGGGGGCCSPPDSSYGPPPPTGYGPPSGGGGYGGGGGGWGRSFGRRFITSNYDQTNHTNVELINDQNNSNYTNSNDYEAPQRYQYLNNSHVGNNSDTEALLSTESDNYTIDTDPYQNADSKVHAVDPGPVDYVDSVNHVGSTNYAVNRYDTIVARPIYGDEWQATEEMHPSNLRREVRERNENLDTNDPSSYRI